MSTIRKLKRNIKKESGAGKKARKIQNNFKKDLYSKRSQKNPKKAFLKLKYDYSIEDANAILDGLGKTPYIDSLLGTVLPYAYSQLGKTVEYNVISEKFDKEWMWSALTAFRYSSKINTFLELKKKYDYEFLHGNYDFAYEHLRAIEKEVCVSMWSIEKKILTIEYRDGVEENKKYLQVISESGSATVVNIVADYLSSAWQKTPNFQKLIPAQSQLKPMIFFSEAFFLSSLPHK
jgi:hypothetical protein